MLVALQQSENKTAEKCLSRICCFLLPIAMLQHCMTSQSWNKHMENEQSPQYISLLTATRIIVTHSQQQLEKSYHPSFSQGTVLTKRDLHMEVQSNPEALYLL